MTDVVARLGAALADRYRIERELGAGGMATVYLAHDVRHDRKVALKVLRPELSAILGAGRFLHEIKTTANLQHPHILSLFDSGEAEGLVFYVMPYVEGESLRDRLNREKQLPVEDAVRIACEVADALQYAHGQGVVHRDIKPENILLHGGHAMVADFGIALAASRSEGSTRMTETGMSLGTPAYMSPEQAMGEREITPRSDIYALGAVLYEMLSGEPPFSGPTAQAIIARVMTEEPRSLTLHRHTIPPHVEAAVRKALEKLPADRFETGQAFAVALTNPAFTAGSHSAARAANPPRSRPLTYVVAAAFLALAGLAVWGWFRPQPVLPVEERQVILMDRANAEGGDMAIAPDGSAIVWFGASGVMLKERDRITPTFLETVRNPPGPSFSPDGKWIALIADGRLERVSRSGGAPVVLSDSTMLPNTVWLDNDTILSLALGSAAVFATPASGGVTRRVFTMDSTRVYTDVISFVSAVPGADAAVLTIAGNRQRAMALDLRTGKAHDIQPGAQRAWVVGGWLLYTEGNGALYEVPFDTRRLVATGSPNVVLESISSSGTAIAIARNGTLIYIRGAGSPLNETEFARFSLEGSVERLDSAQKLLAGGGLDFSPDGQRVAVGVTDSASRRDIYVFDLRGRAPVRLTYRGGHNIYPTWSPDGQWIMYGSDAGSRTAELWARRADGNGPESLLVSEPRSILGGEWSRDGRWIVYRTDNATTGHGDIVGVRTHGDTTRVPLAVTPARELSPAVSPDSRWLAYSSDASGRQEVYVQPFPEAAGLIWQVSTDGGEVPRWSHDGSRLFYVSADGHMIAADVQTSSSFAVVRRRVLFAVPESWMGFPYHHTYSVTPDDRHFVTLVPRTGAPQAAGRRRLIEIDHWRPGSGVKLGR